jgi:tetratricopeptide (TPR) repeat protein
MALILSVGGRLHFRTVNYLTSLVLLTSTAFAADRWLRLSEPGVEIWTNAGEPKAKLASRFLQQIQQIVLSLQPGAPPSSRTLRLLLFRTVAEFARFRQAGEERAAAFFLAGRQYDYIVMSSEVQPGIRPVIFHEYLHVFSRDRNLPLPHWFAEGVSELFSNARITGTEIELGDPIPAHAQKLLAERDLTLTSLFTPGDDLLFYPKSWALVRLFTLDADYRSHLPRFLSLVAAGEPHSFAFEEAFGKSVEEIGADVRASLTGHRITPWVMKTELRAAVDEARPVVAAPDLVMADLLEDLQRHDEARAILTRLAQEHDDAEIESRLGDLSMHQGNSRHAVEHYSKAIQLGTTDPRIYFERAMLRRDDDAARQQVIADLRKAVELKPDYSEAYQQLNALTLREQTPTVAPKSTGKGWTNRKGDRQVDGTLVELNCSAAPARFMLKTAEGEVTLLVSDPAQVVIGNDTGVSAELNCGAMPPRAVSVEYLAASKEITAIQFK